MKPQSHLEKVLYEALLNASFEVAGENAENYATLLTDEAEKRLGSRAARPKLLLTRAKTIFKDERMNFEIEVGL
jgi:hypothetical protein